LDKRTTLYEYWSAPVSLKPLDKMKINEIIWAILGALYYFFCFTLALKSSGTQKISGQNYAKMDSIIREQRILWECLESSWVKW
jgi:hypothetical protein